MEMQKAGAPPAQDAAFPLKTQQSMQDTVQPFKFNLEDKKGAMNQTMMKKMEQVFKKKIEKNLEKARSKTPETLKRERYSEVVDGPLLVDYLKAMHWFKDEMDEEGEQ